jgi:predicted amino acid racemase
MMLSWKDLLNKIANGCEYSLIVSYIEKLENLKNILIYGIEVLVLVKFGIRIHDQLGPLRGLLLP